jgi:hypothetical protein
MVRNWVMTRKAYVPWDVPENGKWPPRLPRWWPYGRSYPSRSGPRSWPSFGQPIPNNDSQKIPGRVDPAVPPFDPEGSLGRGRQTGVFCAAPPGVFCRFHRDLSPSSSAQATTKDRRNSYSSSFQTRTMKSSPLVGLPPTVGPPPPPEAASLPPGAKATPKTLPTWAW